MVDIKITIAYLLILTSILIVFNRGFDACIGEEVRYLYKPFKLIMYSIFFIAVILALLSIIHPLFMKISEGILLFFLLIALMMNICSLYLPE